MSQEYAIEMRGITKTFGSVVANKNVNLTVNKGEILSILEKAPPSSEPTQYIIDRVQKYIGENLAQNLSLSAVAEHINISKYYLSHLFKDVTGITITEFRNELRLTAAKNMLVHTQKSIDEIAAEIGFSTTAYFTEIFTRAEKIPPSKYRKYHQR